MVLTVEQTAFLQREQSVEQYFQGFNRGDFQVVAELFTDTGRLLAPFEEPIAGRDRILTYLQREAKGMEATPQEMHIEPLEGNCRRVVVKGSVTAIVFQVNAAWIFELTTEGHIEQVRVKLLASLQDLASLRS